MLTCSGSRYLKDHINIVSFYTTDSLTSISKNALLARKGNKYCKEKLHNSYTKELLTHGKQNVLPRDASSIQRIFCF
jgi:hypothetical protein